MSLEVFFKRFNFGAGYRYHPLQWLYPFHHAYLPFKYCEVLATTLNRFYLMRNLRQKIGGGIYSKRWSLFRFKELISQK